MPTQEGRPWINSANMDLYLESGIKDSLSTLINKIFEKYLIGRLFELEDDNYDIIVRAAEQIKSTPQDVLNMIIRVSEIEIRPVAKGKIILDTSPIQQKKKSCKVNVNKIKNW